MSQTLFIALLVLVVAIFVFLYRRKKKVENKMGDELYEAHSIKKVNLEGIDSLMLLNKSRITYPYRRTSLSPYVVHPYLLWMLSLTF